MKTTIVDVAKCAGVSVATVSRVVNGNYPVKEETRLRVLKSIHDLKYVPNIQARELNTQRSTTIGVVVPGLYNMFFAEVINGIEACLASHEYSLLLSCGKNDSAIEMRSVTDLLSRSVSGIIVISPNSENIAGSFYDKIAEKTPLAFINSYQKRPHILYVSNDEYSGQQAALRYLLRLGHRGILFVRGIHSDSYQIKEEAYTALMMEEGLFCAENILNIGEGNSVDTVDHTMERLLAALPNYPDATAIVTCNDLMAVGAVNACRRLGKAVPQDISVIGYDNISLSRLVEPKLTTMDQNMFALGENAARLLLRKIDGETLETAEIVLQNRLVERETAARRKGKSPRPETTL